MKKDRNLILKSILLACLSIFALFGRVEQAEGFPSYTTAIGFYRGFTISTGMSSYDRRTLIISFGEDIEQVLEPEDFSLNFSSPVDFYFEFEDADFPIALVPGEYVMAALLDNIPFEDVDAGLLDQLELTSGLPSIPVDVGDTVVLLTENIYFKLGNFSYDPDGWIVHFTYEKLKVIPEPSSIVLLGLGLLLIVRNMWCRKHRK